MEKVPSKKIANCTTQFDVQYFANFWDNQKMSNVMFLPLTALNFNKFTSR